MAVKSLPLSVLAEYIELYVKQFVSIKTKSNEDLDATQVLDLVTCNQPAAALWMCSKFSQGFANWTKSSLFLSTRELCNAVRQSTFDERLTRWIHEESVWVQGNRPSDSLRVAIQENCARECEKVINANYKNYKFTTDPAMAGTYIHEVLAPTEIFPLVGKYLYSAESQRHLAYYLSGRLISDKYPFTAATPDCIVANDIDDEADLLAYLTENVDNRLNSTPSTAPFNVIAGNRSIEAIVELKTFARGHHHEEDQEYLMYLDDRAERRGVMLELLKSGLLAARKMCSRDKLEKSNRHLKPIFGVGTECSYAWINYNIHLDEDRFPKDRYMPKFWQHADCYGGGTVPVSEVVKRPGKMLVILFDITSKDNTVLFDEVYEGDDVPLVLMPQTPFHLQMLEQALVMPKKKRPKYFTHILAFKAPQDAKVDKRDPECGWRQSVRPAMLCAFNVLFSDAEIDGMGEYVENRLFRELYKQKQPNVAKENEPRPR